MQKIISIDENPSDALCWESNPILWSRFVRAKQLKDGKAPNKVHIFTGEFCAQWIDFNCGVPMKESE
jgi:hypothetical protein